MTRIQNWAGLVSAIILGGACLVLPVTGQDDGPPPPPPADAPPTPPADTETGRPVRDGFRRQMQQQYLAMLKETDAAEYERLTKLRDENPQQFTREIRERIGRELWQGAGPGGMGMGGKGPGGGMGMGRGGGPGQGSGEGMQARRGRPEFVTNALWEKLKKEDPDEYERLQALQKTDPEAFRKEVRKKLIKGREQELLGQAGNIDFKQREQEIHDLAQQLRKAPDGPDKEKLKQELEAKLGDTFDQMLRVQEEQIDRIEREVQNMRQKLEERRNLRDQVVERRMEQLMSNERPGPPRRPPDGAK